MADDLVGTPPPKTGGGAGKKGVGGIPMWGWAAIAGAGAIVVYIWYRNRQTTKAASTSTNSGSNPTTYDLSQGLATDQYEALLALMRDVQGSESSEHKGRYIKRKIKPGDDDIEDSDDGDIEVHSGNKESLNSIAAKHHTSASQIISTTRKHHQLTSRLSAYIKRHHFSTHLPSGTTLWIPQAEDE